MNLQIFGILANPAHYQLGLAVMILLTSFFLLYLYLLPMPIPGIPFNVSATKSIFGDLPALQREADGKAPLWMGKQAKQLSSPICQLFIVPFSKPVVVIADYREAQDILMRHSEWDRADFSSALISGAADHHHFTFKTGQDWKMHRRLLQDLMTPKFLSGTAAGNIYNSALHLVALWDAKERIACGRPFSVEKDIYYTALDAVLDFTFGNNYSGRAVSPQIDAIVSKERSEAIPEHASKDNNVPVVFNEAPVDPVVEALLQCSESIADVMRQGLFTFAWWWKKKQKREIDARAMRSTFLQAQVTEAVKRLQQEDDIGDSGLVTSAIDAMIRQEQKIASKDNREPVFWSPTMRDEMLGFIVAGHETTATTMCWAIKFLTDDQGCQEVLRKELQTVHKSAMSERRTPSHEEITQSDCPLLDAVIEEILRLSHTLPLLARQCSKDAVVLGHRIPKGTTVFIPTLGPSLTEPAFTIDDSLRHKSSKASSEGDEGTLKTVDDLHLFRPERWLHTQNGKSVFNPAAAPALPFGSGIRGCFGRKLAYLEMRLLTTVIIWNFELLACPDHLSGHEEVLGITRMPQKCYVRLKKNTI